ncbi:protein SMALL AUXIN UP-REGULATED RNA 10 [Elaeis guineensis]|uniref:Auxin-responsive protein SAUR50 n=1 Tax=Elaeis guineensis var. tenera TaxID=51953 RepID=A0A6I9QYH3_ELAGV|nr:auxin-responsive protein SAUR50 [Elaeis guineensis]XP_010917418.1 auxin-responsive protein SAUR50 [Elaeis guineensis]XP_010917419.1 auxin-responsive protein SAUR50 [Elaeis guineensis]
MGDENVKVTGIRQIVRFREMLHKWHSTALGTKENESKASGIPPAVDKRLKNVCNSCDSDEEGCQSPEPPPDVPKGYIPIYVGPEHRRFVIPTSYLSLPLFKLLLEKAEEEFGFDHRGAITIPCEIETFKYILQCMERHQKGLIDDRGNPTGLGE